MSAGGSYSISLTADGLWLPLMLFGIRFAPLLSLFKRFKRFSSNVVFNNIHLLKYLPVVRVHFVLMLLNKVTAARNCESDLCQHGKIITPARQS
jgi:hypothetical protein